MKKGRGTAVPLPNSFGPDRRDQNLKTAVALIVRGAPI